MHCVHTCHCNWFKKQADWFIAKQDKVKRESQTENGGIRKGGDRGVSGQTEKDSDTQNRIEVKAPSLSATHRLIEMG